MATKITLRLLVDKNRNKVLFAESGKDFVDFLFSLMTLPVGIIMRLLTPTQTTTGCVGNLYSSIENLDNLYTKPKVKKSLLLEPTISSSGNEMQMLLEGNEKSQSDEPITPTYYRCDWNSPCKNYVTDVMGTKCGHCHREMTSKLCLIKGKSSTMASGGYVKEVVTYMITDDLEVKPMSTISGITFLNRYAVKDIGQGRSFGHERGFGFVKGIIAVKIGSYGCVP